MATAIDMQFTPTSQRKFSELIREMQDLTHKELPTVLKATGRDFCREAIKVTPLARRLTEDDFRVGDGYLITLHQRRTGNTVTFVGTKEQFDKYARRGKGEAGQLRRRPGQYPRGRGYARIGWLYALINLGVTIKLQLGKAPSAKSIRETGDYVDRLRAQVPFLEVANRVDYIEDLDRGANGRPSYQIMARALTATANRMEATLTKLSKKMADTWRK